MSTNPASSPSRPWWKKLLRWLLFGLLFVCLLVVGRSYFAFRDRLAGYSLSLDIDSTKAKAEPRQFKAGFARISITPDVSNPQRPVWLAGFSQNRAATGVHDDLWAIACVLDDGWTRVGFVALDAIGFFQDDVVQVRRRAEQNPKLDFITVCSTHNHSTPDLMGLWGPNPLHSGVNADYREKVIQACVQALSLAASNLEPARVTFHEIATPTAGLVADTRKPEVYDGDIRVMHFTQDPSGRTIGSIVNWGNHPETPWSRNQEVTSDFCGYLRDALADGIKIDGRQFLEGVGGIHMYVNGAVGGLMSTTPGVTVRHPFLETEYKEPSHDKARAVGHQLAVRVLPRLRDTNAVGASHAPISVHARSIQVHLDNKAYLLAGFLGLIDRGYVGWRKLRTEVSLLTVGEASIACVPGEIYPEIVNGGVEKPLGADFDIPIVETPPLRQMMPGTVKFLFGLANDEIGYIIPKTEWDQQAPFGYGAKHAPYGEINSVGPDTAPAIHGALRELCIRK